MGLLEKSVQEGLGVVDGALSRKKVPPPSMAS